LADTELELKIRGGRARLEGPGDNVIGHAFGRDSGVDQPGIGYQFPGGGLMAVNAGTRSITWTDTGTTYVATFDLGQGGIIRSFTRDGVELLQGGTKGVEAQLIWTDTNQTGEFVRHDLVQGSDRWGTDPTNRRGGLVRSFTNTTLSDGTVVVSVELWPIVHFSDGYGSIPGVTNWHDGGELHPVYAFGIPMTVTHQFGIDGNKDLHKTTVTVDNREELVNSAFFDMSLYVAFYSNTTTFSQMEAWDGTTASAIAELNRRYTMDSAVRQGDDETSSNATYIATEGWVQSRGGSTSDQALAVGGALASDDKSGNRQLGDARAGNGWSWNNDSSDRLICYGQWLTNRIHSSTAQRVLPVDATIVGDVFWATGTATANRSLIGTVTFAELS
jgi:hypothetical protein